MERKLLCTGYSTGWAVASSGADYYAETIARIAHAPVLVIFDTQRFPNPILVVGVFDASIWRGVVQPRHRDPAQGMPPVPARETPSLDDDIHANVDFGSAKSCGLLGLEYESILISSESPRTVTRVPDDRHALVVGSLLDHEGSHPSGPEIPSQDR